ncbi:unnamed protein product, partial [Chrysoparadoxa australica]
SGLEKHSQLVSMATKRFWAKQVPLPPAPPAVEQDNTAIINGETSICGWMLLKGPHDKAGQKVFCDLHGSELLYHKAIPLPEAPPNLSKDGAIDMGDITQVATTRTSEHGQRDLRMVNSEGQVVWMISVTSAKALTKWQKKLNTAMIVGPGTRTSKSATPSIPYLVERTHNSLTVSWRPPRQPYLNTVHSFQVQYRAGAVGIGPWSTASDEVHATMLVIQGLDEGEKHVIRVRAMHESDSGKVGWGKTEAHKLVEDPSRQVQVQVQPPVHLWVFVHGVHGDEEDFRYMSGELTSRYGSDVKVLLASSNAGMLQTCDGIDKGGIRLFEEVLLVIERTPTLRCISFAGHGIGGLYCRYAVQLLDERGVFSHHLHAMNFVTFGCPHVGSITYDAGE